ncbi:MULTISPECIES: twin-arginine translocase subunit TatC [Micromonospora]|uniref:Sec-independent protein translocase protein TatC n=1 Tax=Micromonospora chalcea TaxID=1874 RepID=A0ABX9YAU2_MICCH|nr:MULTISPECIES: twin-arginine translocase subunit TatC [Micromonospora]EWM63884.1 twin arginine-targeting protein translocase TatC [Micromonospora sp. M42]MBP1783229.1 sec-independent protein translocase protein TatC [Micromonospora sp. HB375]MCK1810297.1 twin-arginine translocase subunit TatC [Micromonospora sp. R42106]MCK1835599.1 twin-arginine translocase subunit TatC [Micromonospora sp. R42003]MCK1845459.1 twin-arginine translocase subunit TatC [Micromonospora sp. R42004]
MAFGLKKRGPSNFARAADGSMTLMEHIRELRNRLFRASLAILVGFGFGVWLSGPVLHILQKPYCDLPKARLIDGNCNFVQLGPADLFLLQMKVALWVGLIIAAPIWLYQLWAFIAPGLHRHERRYAYFFTALAAPLFAAGAVLAYFVTSKGLEFLLNVSGGGDVTTTLDITRYVGFVTNLILLFGVAFEFPLIVLMLNFVGLASAKRLLSWWRVAVFVFFAFSAVVTPTPDPFGMTALAICLCALYFAAVGVAFINDKRRGRGREVYAGIADDEVSPLDLSTEPVPAGGRIEASEPIGAPEPVVAPKPIERRYDDMT